MATYIYFCEKCEKDYEIIKSMHDASRCELCEQCAEPLTRIYTSFQIMGAKVEDAEYNIGLGCVTKSKRHREEIAKQNGLIEVGNESKETLYKESVVKRAKEREREWDEL
jgi:putative FmdB family regulatory protein